MSSVENKIERLVKEHKAESGEALVHVIQLASKMLKSDADNNGEPAYTQEEFNEFMDYALLGAILDRVTT